ncbi:hypothetical protein LTR85_002687 [Meristemomyces frigidus]|nr:hypothetical protein LTR85_002687 [Meristemomyces frigidus]
MIPASTSSAIQQHFLLDGDDTPRAKSTGTKRPAAGIGKDSSGDSDSPSKRSRSTVSEGSRASSPTKPNILRSLQNPIRSESIDSAKLSDDARQLVRQVRRFAAGFETVPQALRESMEEAYPDDMDLTQNVTYVPDSQRASLGDDLSHRDVASICRQAQGCQHRNEYEAAWNSHVHGPLLSLVVELSCHKSTVGSTNVTTARLNPRFKPMVDISQAPLPGKVVDFVFFLEPSNVTEMEFGALPWEPNHGHDFNHILHGPIANRPIAISMETKREGEGQTTGRTQLDIWVTAQFNRLQELAGIDTAGLPTLPLLLTQGPAWFLLLAHREQEGEALVTTIFEKITLGDIARPSGVFRVVSSLLLLVHWAQTVFRPWFERAVTGEHVVNVQRSITSTKW